MRRIRGRRRGALRPLDLDAHVADARHRTIAETLRAVPWEGDPATDRITYVGPQIETLTGYSMAEWVVPGQWHRALHPDDRDAVIRKYEWHLERRRDHNLEYRLVTASGRQIWFRDIITFVTGADGRELVRGLMIMIEEEKALERALRESEARYKHAEQIAGLVHWSCRRPLEPVHIRHVKLVFSEHASALFGLPPAQLSLSTAEFLERIVHPEDRDLVDRKFAECLAARRPQYNLDYRILRPDGSIAYVAEICHDNYDNDGVWTDSFGTLLDVTELRQREMELSAACLRADLASRAKTQFLATMSHELRTPLNAIIGFSEAMKMELMGPLGTQEYKDYANDIHGSGTFLLAIINELLDLSLIDSGEMKLDEAVVQVDKIAASSVSLLRSKAAAKGVKLAQAVGPNPSPLLRGDARRIKQAVLNLLANAIKFTPAGGSVEIATDWSSDGMVVMVRDTGIGIAAEDIDRVMKPFVQLENWLARNHEGAGLGLPITKGICELHGGTLLLDSEPGKGTIARICLPASRIAGSDIAGPDAAPAD